MPRFQFMLVNRCGSPQYGPEITTFRPYDTRDARIIPNGLYKMIVSKLWEKSSVFLYEHSNEDRWAYPTYSVSDGAEERDLEERFEGKHEFLIWTAGKDLREFRNRVRGAKVIEQCNEDMKCRDESVFESMHEPEKDVEKEIYESFMTGIQ